MAMAWSTYCIAKNWTQRNRGIDVGGVVFGIQEVEYGMQCGGVFLWNDPNGVNLQVQEGRGAESSCRVAQGNLFKHVLACSQLQQAEWQCHQPSRRHLRCSHGEQSCNPAISPHTMPKGPRG